MAALAPAFRISIFLPVNGPQLDAANEVVAYMKETHSGATLSSTDPPRYTGYWVDDSEIVWEDRIAIAFVGLLVAKAEGKGL